MKRVVLILGSIALWTLLITSCYLSIKIMDLKMNCTSTYYYTDLNGNKGEAEHCFKADNNYICRDIKHVIRVNKVVEKKVCNNVR